MESIEKLRKMDDGMLVPLGNGQYVPDHSHNDIADEIEAEIDERYMELPLDADGVPIRCGDFVDGGMGDSGKVQHVELWPDGFVVVYECHPGTFTRYAPDAVRHVKPRTIEDVLRDCCNEWNEHCGNDWEQSVYAKYADEIRGLL